MKILALDGNSIINRAFYGIRILSNKNGVFTNAIYGFMNILLKLIDTNSPDLIIAAFDLKAPTFRHKIYDEYNLRESGFMSMIRAYIIELITLIFREIDKKTLLDITKEQRDVVGKAIEYMKSNFNAKINLDDIVADIFLSKDYFRQLFKKTTGISITEYIQKTRIEAACKLLLETDRTVFDIAGDCGFSDIKFFYKTFKKITNKTPNEYRKEQGNNIEVQDD